MTEEIHPLQESSVTLLKKLYEELHFPATRAMIDIANRCYPSIENILDTLEHYKDKEPVIQFLSKHEAIINNAKEKVRNKRKSPTKKDNKGSIDDYFSSIFGKPQNVEIVDACKCIKSVSLKEIEEAFSKEISNLCKEDLLIEIESLQSVNSSSSTNAELKIIIKPMNSIRYN